MENDVGEVLISHEQIREKTKELGRRIAQDYEGKNLSLIHI